MEEGFDLGLEGKVEFQQLLVGQGEMGWQNSSMHRHKGMLGGSWGTMKRATHRWVEANPRESQSQTRSGVPREVLEQGRDKLRKAGWEVVRSRTGGRMLAHALPQPYLHS